MGVQASGISVLVGILEAHALFRELALFYVAGRGDGRDQCA